MMEQSYAVEIKNLTKKYGGNRALDDISFTVRHGEIMGFLGPNGAGKSTTMNILCGCISASSGSACVCGCDVLENPMIVKSKIGYLPENPPLYLDMTVWEYLSFVYELKKVKGNRSEHLSEIMELVRITDMKNRMIKNLSKGYKQRVGLAQALIGSPEVLVLDEPTVGLDPKQIVEIRNVIKEIGKQRTIILSTHILQEVSAVCDRVTIISHGKIVAQDTIDGLENRTGGKDSYILSVFDEPEKAKEAIAAVKDIAECNPEETSEEGVYSFRICQKSGSDIRRALSKELSARGVAVAQFKSASLSLEEIFIRLTADENAETENTEKPENLLSGETETELDVKEEPGDESNL